MVMHEAPPAFRDRIDAGQRLAKNLGHYKSAQVIVFAIPRGGVPVAVEVAKQLGSRLDIVIPRKIPIPYNPEAGYGAVTEDGIIVLNEPLVESLQLTHQEIERHAEEAKAEIKRRSALYRRWLKPSSVEGKTAIIIDDGLASGYTMIAAVKSIRRQGAATIIVAVPVASSGAWKLIKAIADEVVCLFVAHTYHFAVASFYRHWHDLTDREVFEALEGFTKHYGGYAHE